MKGGSNKLLTAAQAAKRLNRSRSQFYKTWRHLGIPAYRVGRVLRFRVRDLENWLEKHKAE